LSQLTTIGVSLTISHAPASAGLLGRRVIGGKPDDSTRPARDKIGYPSIVPRHVSTEKIIATCCARRCASAPTRGTADRDTPFRRYGVDPEAIGEALSLAGTMLVLGDPGRKKEWAQPNKPAGSVHGDSVGVHASDAANGWRHIAKVANARNTFASLIAAAYHTAGQAGWQMSKPYLLVEDVERVESKDGDKLIAALDEALRGKDQKRAAAVASRYGQLGHDARAIFAKLRQYAVSEDGALHAEKYYNTVSEEYGRSREKFRWLHVVALARVTASAAGQAAPGVAEARRLLGV
jgi:hypothetical protein